MPVSGASARHRRGDLPRCLLLHGDHRVHPPVGAPAVRGEGCGARRGGAADHGQPGVLQPVPGRRRARWRRAEQRRRHRRDRRDGSGCVRVGAWRSPAWSWRRAARACVAPRPSKPGRRSWRSPWSPFSEVEPMRYESSVTSLSWIPSESMAGMYKLPFELTVTHYDPPPEDTLTDLESVRASRPVPVRQRVAGLDRGRPRPDCRVRLQRERSHRRDDGPVGVAGDDVRRGRVPGPAAGARGRRGLGAIRADRGWADRLPDAASGLATSVRADHRADGLDHARADDPPRRSHRA